MGRHRVALVLGAGGPVGFAFHAGVLAALAEAGWDARDAELILGTSVGAATAALLRAGMAPHDLYARARRQPLSEGGETLITGAGGWPDLSAALAGHDGRGLASRLAGGLRHPAAPRLVGRLLRHPGRWRAGLLLAALLPAGEVEAAPIVAALDRLFPAGWPAAGLGVVAADLDRGTRMVFGAPGAPAASVGTAVAASCAVPSVFAPVVVDGRRYVDGGAVSPVSTDLLAPALVGAGPAVAGEAAGPTAAGEPAPAPFDAVVVSLPMGIGAAPGRIGVDLPGRWLNHLAGVRGLAAARRSGVPVLLVEPGASELAVMGYDVFSVTHGPEIAARARDRLAARLAAGLREGRGPLHAALGLPHPLDDPPG